MGQHGGSKRPYKEGSSCRCILASGAGCRATTHHSHAAGGCTLASLTHGKAKNLPSACDQVACRPLSRGCSNWLFPCHCSEELSSQVATGWYTPQRLKAERSATATSATWQQEQTLAGGVTTTFATATPPLLAADWLAVLGVWSDREHVRLLPAGCCAMQRLIRHDRV